MHYEHENASQYDIKDALEALNVFMHRTKESEINELNRKYAALHTAPLESLYADFPEGAERPPGAIRVYRQERQQDFPRPGRGSQRPFRQRVRRNYQNTGSWGRGRRPNNRQQNIQQVMNLLTSLM